MSQIDMPFIAINNKGLEVKNITKSYSKKKYLIMFLSILIEVSQ